MVITWTTEYTKYRHTAKEKVRKYWVYTRPQWTPNHCTLASQRQWQDMIFCSSFHSLYNKQKTSTFLNVYLLWLKVNCSYSALASLAENCIKPLQGDWGRSCFPTKRSFYRGMWCIRNMMQGRGLSYWIHQEHQAPYSQNSVFFGRGGGEGEGCCDHADSL